MQASLAHKINHDGARLTLQVGNVHALAIARLQLLQQGQGIVVIDKAHGLAWIERVERTKNGRMAKTLGYAARVKRVDGIGRSVNMCSHGEGGQKSWNQRFILNELLFYAAFVWAFTLPLLALWRCHSAGQSRRLDHVGRHHPGVEFVTRHKTRRESSAPQAQTLLVRALGNLRRFVVANVRVQRGLQHQ